jgi:hypothetical protein
MTETDAVLKWNAEICDWLKQVDAGKIVPVKAEWKRSEK